MRRRQNQLTQLQAIVDISTLKIAVAAMHKVYSFDLQRAEYV